MRFGNVLRLLLIAALAPPLLYYAGDILLGEGMWPVWHWMLAASSLMAAAIAAVAKFWWPPLRVNQLFRVLQTLVRYCLALLLIYFAFNKLIPGQFLLYSRDFDLPLRDLPPRRLAWHFLGHSALYNGFIAGLELVAGALLCWPRTVLGGLLLTAGLTLNIVLIDAAFGIPALPIPVAMALAAFVLIAGHMDALRPLIWRSPAGSSATPWPRNKLLALGALAVIVGVSVWQNVEARRGLSSQLPPTGRWEVMECAPDPGLAICRAHPDTARAVLYLEIGGWGELVTDAGRRSLEFSYDGASKQLEVRIEPHDSGAVPGLVLRGTVAEADTSVLLEASGPGLIPFEVRLRRTRRAPWPPVRIGG